jgi:alpha-ketoglutarate-dependent taurine dioxygenase
VAIDPATLVAFTPPEAQPVPVVVQPTRSDVDLVAWLASESGRVEDALVRHGALLFRGFALAPAHVPHAVRALAGEPLTYRERSTPRTALGDGLYTSTEYPADQHIPMHHENAYAHVCPRKLWFYCEQPAPDGGETPLADGAAVYRGLDAAVRDAFDRRGVLYVRNYRAGEDLPWQLVFQTDDPRAVERYCAGARIACAWRPDGSLRTCQARTAAIRHPHTGEPVWFNQAHLFHASSHNDVTRTALAALYAPTELPRHAWYGDGAAIPDSHLAAVRDAYRRATITFAWQRGDLLLVDNLRIAHGRRPFTGRRRVTVAMSDPWIDLTRLLPAVSPRSES